MLKNPMRKNNAKEDETNENLVMTDLNTLLNGSPTNNERKLIMAMKKLVELEQIRSEECNLCKEMLSPKKRLEMHRVTQHGEHFECDSCDQVFDHKDELQNHASSQRDDELDSQGVDIENVFLSHHAEDQEDEELEFNLDAWNILINGIDEKCLTREEQKDILKLHKYFAHRSGKKLWENLL